MRASSIVKLAAVALIFAAVPLPAQWPEVKTKRVPLTRDGKPNLTAPAPKIANGKTPDLSGVWLSEKAPCEGTSSATFGCNDAPEGIPIGFIDITATSAEEVDRGAKIGLPYQPWAAALARQRIAGMGKDSPTPRCLPMPSIAHWNSFHPQKLVQTEEALIVLDEYMDQYRQIFLDGRPLPKDPFPYFKGYSVARWEGDTLVVDTTNFTDKTAFRGASEKMHLVERFTRVDPETLLYSFTVDDPSAFAKPWTAEITSVRGDGRIFEYACHEGNYGMEGLLKGARADDKKAAGGAGK